MNSVHLVGRLAQDPEVRGGGDEPKVATLRISVLRRPGTKGLVTISVLCFDRLAAAVEEWLYERRRVAVEGRLEQCEWIDAEGSQRWRHQVIAERIEFLDARPPPEEASQRVEGRWC